MIKYWQFDNENLIKSVKIRLRYEIYYTWDIIKIILLRSYENRKHFLFFFSSIFGCQTKWISMLKKYSKTIVSYFSQDCQIFENIYFKITTRLNFSTSHTLHSRELYVLYFIFIYYVILKSNKLKVWKYENKNEILISKILFEIFSRVNIVKESK